jgi:hypothetical protein
MGTLPPDRLARGNPARRDDDLMTVSADPSPGDRRQQETPAGAG